MKKWLSLVMVVIFGLAPFSVWADEGIPILMYHHFTEGSDVNSVTVSKENFEAQMKYLYDNGYQTLTFQELEDYIDGKKENNGKMVVITMDDGYRSNYTIAYPILKQYGMHATQFTIVSGIGGLTDNIFRLGRYKGGHSTIEEMNEMKDVFEFQSHTYDRHLLVEEKSVLANDYLDGVRKDLGMAHDILTREGFPQYVFSYPYGQHSGSIKAVLEELGIRMAVVVRGAKVKVGSDKLELPRFNVSGEMSLEEFKALVKTKENNEVSKLGADLQKPNQTFQASPTKIDLNAFVKKYMYHYLKKSEENKKSVA